MRFRFSISVMMAVVFLAGIVFAESAYGGSSNLNFIIILTPSVPVLGLLCTAILGASLKRDEKRGFWLGFAVFGWAFFVVGWLGLFRLPVLAVLGRVPFGYIGGVIGRSFAAERLE
jgi:hypothetical protein